MSDNNNHVLNEGIVQETYTKIRWSPFKIIMTILLISAGAVSIYFGISPLLEATFELKSFANLIFVLFQVYYIFSFFGVKKTSQFIFWCASYILLIASSMMFFFYDSIFV